jgi:metal-dependent amidase/aminoacylase/carboxypeptidase family protein
VTKGGDAANIVPAHTSARYMIRALRLEGLEALRERVFKCFEAGAIATGSSVEIVGGRKPYAQVEHDNRIARLYGENATALGRNLIELGRPSGSTDMGNVSLAVPSIHPFIGIDSGTAVNHQPEFTACCILPPADQAVMDGAIGMAWTALDIASDEALSEQLRTGDRAGDGRG